MLPIPLPMQICSCGPNQDFTVLPGKQTVLVTINGMFCHFLLPFYIQPDEVNHKSGLLYTFVLCCTNTGQIVNTCLF